MLIGEGDFFFILIIRFSRKENNDFNGEGRSDLMLFNRAKSSASKVVRNREKMV